MAYLMSWAVAPRMFYSKYTIYLILLGSDVVLFFMSYEFFKKEKDLETFFKALIFSNALVVVYCVIQYFIGHGQLSFFGITELSVLENRWDERLVGPFQAVGITAEYLVIQSLLLAHYMVHAGRLRRMGYLLLFCNLAILVGTGNRGGFIIAILGVFSFMYFYKRYIGGRGIAIAGLVFFVMLAVTSFIMITYTEYNTLYDRLLGTHVSGITPDSRIGWGDVVEEISNRPILGHGPRLVLPD